MSCDAARGPEEISRCPAEFLYLPFPLKILREFLAISPSTRLLKIILTTSGFSNRPCNTVSPILDISRKPYHRLCCRHSSWCSGWWFIAFAIICSTMFFTFHAHLRRWSHLTPGRIPWRSLLFFNDFGHILVVANRSPSYFSIILVTFLCC